MTPAISSDDIAQLLQYHLLFAHKVAGVEVRALDQVGDQFDAQAQVLGHDARGEAGAVALGAGVEVAADILDRLADFSRGSTAGALEHHVLEQVRDAVG